MQRLQTKKEMKKMITYVIDAAVPPIASHRFQKF